MGSHFNLALVKNMEKKKRGKKGGGGGGGGGVLEKLKYNMEFTKENKS